MKKLVWIDEQDALAIHDHLLALHGGPSGVRDEALLASALARPRQYQAYSDQVDIIRMSAVYTSGIVKNHPFVDGNKRTAFVIGVLFLELTGFRFTASEEDAAQAVLSLAAGTLSEEEFIMFLRANTLLED